MFIALSGMQGPDRGWPIGQGLQASHREVGVIYAYVAAKVSHNDHADRLTLSIHT